MERELASVDSSWSERLKSLRGFESELFEHFLTALCAEVGVEVAAA